VEFIPVSLELRIVALDEIGVLDPVLSTSGKP
jgi:hypothetical protein